DRDRDVWTASPSRATELAEVTGVARPTLYNQFDSKEEIFREMLLRVSSLVERAFPPGIETQGDAEDVLRLIARMILKLHENPGYLGFPSHGRSRRPPVSLEKSFRCGPG